MSLIPAFEISLWDAWIFLVMAIFFSIQLLICVSAEERYCLKTYAKEYQDYMNRAPRWIGLPQSLQSNII